MSFADLAQHLIDSDDLGLSRRVTPWRSLTIVVAGFGLGDLVLLLGYLLIAGDR